jgi:hypothetical protein
LFPRLKHLWLDAGYRGEEKGRGWVEKVLGWSVDLVERPRKPAPEEVLSYGPPSGPRKARRWTGTSSCRPKGSRSYLTAG